MSETTKTDALAVTQSAESATWELMQRQAIALSKSDIVPQTFRGNVPNCLLVVDMATRLGANPLMVAQNLYIVHGKPSWASTFIIMCINCSPNFGKLRFRMDGTEGGKDRTCVAYATDRESGEVCESPTVSMRMAEAEGWVAKKDSKWKTMPDLMLRYRAATMFGRLYAPELMMGMHTVDEIEDTYAAPAPRGNPFQAAPVMLAAAAPTTSSQPPASVLDTLDEYPDEPGDPEPELPSEAPTQMRMMGED